MVESILWIALPVTVYGLLAVMVPPAGEAPSPWGRFRAWLRRRRAEDLPAEQADARVQEPVTDDPLEVLAIQVRLGVLADHIRALEADEHVWARARRLEAAQAAYDALLDEACRLAGIPSHLPPPGGPGMRRNSEPDRFEDELALAQRGWSW